MIRSQTRDHNGWQRIECGDKMSIFDFNNGLQNNQKHTLPDVVFITRASISSARMMISAQAIGDTVRLFIF